MIEDDVPSVLLGCCCARQRPEGNFTGTQLPRLHSQSQRSKCCRPSGSTRNLGLGRLGNAMQLSVEQVSCKILSSTKGPPGPFSTGTHTGVGELPRKLGLNPNPCLQNLEAHVAECNASILLIGFDSCLLKPHSWRAFP